MKLLVIYSEYLRISDDISPVISTNWTQDNLESVEGARFCGNIMFRDTVCFRKITVENKMLVLQILSHERSQD